MIHEYVHQPLNREVRSVSGGYVLDREEVVFVNGRQVLCIAGVGIVDTACCGMGGSRYVLVPGWLLSFKSRKNAEGLFVSEVERITEPADREAVSGAVGFLAPTAPVQFL